MNPKIAQTLYSVGAIIPLLLGIFLIWGGIDKGTSDSITDIVGGLISIITGGAPALAAVRVSNQRKDGTFDVLSPAEQVVNNVQAVIQAQADAAADIERVRQAVTSAVGSVPGLGPLAQEIINLGYRRS